MIHSRLSAHDYSAAPTPVEVRSLFNGIVLADWTEAMIARGFGWHVDIGAFSTPITGGGAGTILDQDQPEGVIGVPTGWVLVPLRILVACQVPLLAADSDESEILIAADRLANYAVGGGTVVTETPSNMRTNVTSGCPLTTVSAASGDITNPTLGIELGHAVIIGESGSDVGRNWTDLALKYEPLTPPFIVGPSALYVYFGGTVATTGFVNMDFLAIPSSLVTNLA